MINIGLISLGFEKFKTDIAKEYLDKTLPLLEKENVNIHFYNDIINDSEQLKKVEDSIINKVDMMVIQVGTFPMGHLVIELIELTKDIPIFIWGFKDPIVDDFNTIPLNSLTGINMFTSYLKRYEAQFSYLYETFDEKRLDQKLLNMIKAIQVKKQLRQSKFGIIGTRAPGFYLSDVNHIDFKKIVGPTLEYYSIGELVNQARAMPEELVKTVQQEKFAHTTLKGLQIQLEKAVRVYLAIKELVEVEKLDAITIKCWPEWQTLYGLSVCPVLSLLNDDGIMTSCEGDVAALATMFVQYQYTNQAPFLADLATISNNRLKAWHCGQVPMSLCDSPIELIEHPTMKEEIGLSIQAEMITSRQITMAKLSELKNEYRLFLARGQSVKPDRYLEGPQTDLILDKSLEETMDLIFNEGIEHHYSISHQDITSELRELCKWMNWRVVEV